MEDQFTTLQNNQDTQSILNDSAKLAGEIIEVKGYLAYLEESQRRLYPDQAPAPGRSRRNKRRAPVQQFVSVEMYRSRILQSVKTFVRMHNRPPTMREINQRIRGKMIPQLVVEMVQAGILKEIMEERRKTMWYAPTGLALAEAKESREEKERQDRKNERERLIRGSMPGVLEAVQHWTDREGSPPALAQIRKGIADLPHWGDAFNRLVTEKSLLIVNDGSGSTKLVIPD